jgi:hypothetical protein
MKLTNDQIKTNPEKYIKWMCFDVFITIDKQVVNLSFQPKKEILSGGSYGYIVNGKFHSKKWINYNCTNVLGNIYNN